jgi:F-type H+-transporting ATPase subunit b
MEALHSLGIDGRLLIAQIINFVILLLLLKKFLYGPLVKMLDTRSEKIKRSLESAEKIENDLKNTEERNRKALAEAQSEAKKLIADAKKSAEEESLKIIEVAGRKALDQKTKALQEIEESKNRAKFEIKAEAAELITLAFEKIAEKKFESADDQKLVKNILKEL